MGNLLAYSGIVTKIRAMQSKLLKPEQFIEVANLGNVPEIVDYLKKIRLMPKFSIRWMNHRSTGAISRRSWSSLFIMTIPRSTGSADRNNAVS